MKAAKLAIGFVAVCTISFTIGWFVQLIPLAAAFGILVGGVGSLLVIRWAYGRHAL